MHTLAALADTLVAVAVACAFSFTVFACVAMLLAVPVETDDSVPFAPSGNMFNPLLHIV